jgi:CRP-like cAMP-binding protein
MRAAVPLEVHAPEEVILPELSESTELDLSDLEEIPLAQPRVIGMAAARALAATPLFAGMPSDALQALVENLQLVSLERGQTLFREGDPGDALYVIAEGEVSVQNEGPPRVEMSRLGPGAFLGEVALMTDQPRSATVVCLQDAELLRIDRHTLSRVLANHGDVLRAVLRFVRDRLVDRWMRTSPLFRPFNDAERIELAAKFKFLEIDGGTVVLGAGERPDGLYIVLAGQFLVLRNKSAVAQLGPGDLIGETALLSGGAFKSDVVARGKGLALCLPAAVFREVIMTHPHVLEYIGEQAEHSRRLQIL